MRCEHVVKKTNPWTKARSRRPCRHRLKSDSEKRIGRLTWHIYKCRFGHETRFYVKP